VLAHLLGYGFATQRRPAGGDGYRQQQLDQALPSWSSMKRTRQQYLVFHLQVR